MAREIATGIDVGTSYTKAVIVEKRKDEEMPSVLGYGISPSSGLRKGFIIDTAETSIGIKSALKKAQEMAGVSVKRVFVSADGIGLSGARSKGSIIVSRTDQEITKNDLERALQQSKIQLDRASSYFLNKDILHSFPVSFKVDDDLIIGDPTGTRGEKLEAETFFITGSSQYLNNLVKSVEATGVTVEDIIAAPWAMSCFLLSQKEKEVGCLLLNIGGDVSSLIVFEDGMPISMETLSIGSNHITYDIAKGFQVLLDEAEQLKISYGSDTAAKRKLDTIVESRLNDIFELTSNHLHKIKRTGILPAGIILTGGGANLKNIEELAKKSLELPSQLSQSKFPKTNLDDMANPVWSVALGLCCAELNKKDEFTSGRSGIVPKGKRIFSKIVKTFLP